MTNKTLRITIVIEGPRDESELQLRILASHIDNAFRCFANPKHSYERNIKEVSTSKKKSKKRSSKYES